MLRTETLCINMELGIKAHADMLNGVNDYLVNLNNPFTKLSIEQLVAFIESRDDPKVVEKIMRLITPAQRNQLRALEEQVEEEVIEESLTEVFSEEDDESEPEELPLEAAASVDEDLTLFEEDDEEEPLEVGSKESDSDIFSEQMFDIDEDEADEYEDEVDKVDNEDTEQELGDITPPVSSSASEMVRNFELIETASDDDYEDDEDWEDSDEADDDAEDDGMLAALSELYGTVTRKESAEGISALEEKASPVENCISQALNVAGTDESFEDEDFEELDNEDEGLIDVDTVNVELEDDEDAEGEGFDTEESFDTEEDEFDADFEDSDAELESEGIEADDDEEDEDIVDEVEDTEAIDDADALAELLAPKVVSAPVEPPIFSHTALSRVVKTTEEQQSVKIKQQETERQEVLPSVLSADTLASKSATTVGSRRATGGISVSSPCNNMRIRRNTVVQELSSGNSTASSSICGEKFDPSWSILQYLSANKDNKAARHIDVVSKYFPISLIQRGEDAGQFIISKGYLRK